MVLVVCMLSMMFYISMKFHENILNGFQVIERIQKDHCQISKGNNSKNVLTRALILVAAHGLMMLYISIKLHELFSSYRADTI